MPEVAMFVPHCIILGALVMQNAGLSLSANSPLQRLNLYSGTAGPSWLLLTTAVLEPVHHRAMHDPWALLLVGLVGVVG